MGFRVSATSLAFWFSATALTWDLVLSVSFRATIIMNGISCIGYISGVLVFGYTSYLGSCFATILLNGIAHTGSVFNDLVFGYTSIAWDLALWLQSQATILMNGIL